MRIHFCFLALFATALSFSGCEEDPTGSSGTAGNQGKPCEREADCDDDNPCTFEFCPDGTCTVEVLSNVENPDAEQVDGDCQIVGCLDGAEAMLPDNDPPEDPNQGDCVIKECTDGVAMDALRPADEGCFVNGMDAVCDAAGTCSCKPPTPTSPHHVDPVNGTDDPNHGGRFGACALKTISYALTLAEAEIRVAPGLYTSASGESPPYVLAGAQDINCADFNGSVPTLQGGGTFMSTTTVIALTGTSNTVRDCIIEGQGAAHAIVVASASNLQHEVRNNDVSGATSGITVLTGGDQLGVQDNRINNNDIGLQWLGVGQSGNIDNNTFGNNATADIVCTDVSPQVVGANNGGPTCQVCENCPF